MVRYYQKLKVINIGIIQSVNNCTFVAEKWNWVTIILGVIYYSNSSISSNSNSSSSRSSTSSSSSSSSSSSGGSSKPIYIKDVEVYGCSALLANGSLLII